MLLASSITKVPEFEFFTKLLILLVAARLLGELFERFKQPSMIGEIIAGIILGPSCFEIIERTEDIKTVSNLGIFFLVIIAGLEINIDDILKSLRGRNFIISIIAFVLPISLGNLVAWQFGLDLTNIIFVGLCVAITALPVSIRILMDLGKINSEVGKRIISVAILDDVLALTILGVMINIKNTDMSAIEITKVAAVSIVKLLLFIVLLAAFYISIKLVVRKGNYIEDSLNKFLGFIKGKEALFAVFFVFVLLFAMFTETLGLHFIVGAFFAALLISESVIGKQHHHTIEKSTTNIAIGFLAPVFFAGIGLEFELGSIEQIGLLLSIIGVSYFSKIAGGYIGGRLAGMKHKASIALGAGLNARGIMELVIARAAHDSGFITDEVYSILVLMGIITTLSTPIMLKYAFKQSDKDEIKKDDLDSEIQEIDPNIPQITDIDLPKLNPANN
jgi:Kef-type K+ transport system membrane component KefB